VNKAELVAQVAKESDLSKDAGREGRRRDVQEYREGFEGRRYRPDRGLLAIFQVAQRKASTGRNPRTGAEVHIPASRVPKFRAGKALKEAATVVSKAIDLSPAESRI